MTVTKQQQLEWLATMWDVWPGINFNTVRMSSQIAGSYNYGMGYHTITRQEWQQERDKMSSKQEVDSSWYDRGELPSVDCECEYNPDNYWVKCKVLFAGVSLYVLGVHQFEVCVKAGDVKFRPLRTEREKAIDELNTLVGDIEKYPT